MKTKILITALALIISGTMAFAQSKTKSDKEQSILTKTEMQKNSVYYTCPMHPDVKSDKPGKCPKCGMDLKEMDNVAISYTCPMHPKVVSDEPGKCTKCGMNLVEKKLPVKSKAKTKGKSCCG